MKFSPRNVALILAAALAAAAPAYADDLSPAPAPQTAELAAQVRALQQQVAELQSKQAENWLTQERTEQIKAIVRDVLEDAKTHGQFEDTNPPVSYKDGFVFQT